MPRTAAVGSLKAASSAASGWVALIATAAAPAGIAEQLERGDIGYRAFATVDVLLARVRRSGPSLIVLWLEDTSSGSLRLVAPLKQRFAEAPVVIVCPTVDRWGVRGALSAGVAVVLTSENLTSGLNACIQAALCGLICVPREHWLQVEPPVLSSREKQILGLVVMGHMNSQIAERLFLAESTVKSHLSSAFGKLGVRSRNEAVKLILDPERGWGMGILGLGVERVDSAAG
jgi:DNA-binding NarL/FixJ family response regulator